MTNKFFYNGRSQRINNIRLAKSAASLYNEVVGQCNARPIFETAGFTAECEDI